MEENPKYFITQLGKIDEIKINGKDLPKEKYPEYEKRIDNILLGIKNLVDMSAEEK